MLLRNGMILRPYVRPLKRVPNLAIHSAGYAVLVLFSIVYGYFMAILPPQLLFIPATPILILGALILWAMPDSDHAPKGITVGKLSFFLAANCLWPSYVAVNLPGIPWLNPQRVALVLLLGLALYGFATSSRLRRDTMETARSDAMIWWPATIFWLMTVITLPMAGSAISFSFSKWLNYQIYWTFMFFIAAYVVRRPGSMTTLVRTMMITCVIIALITIPEYHGGKVPWIDHIPSYLIGDPTIFERVMADQSRLNLGGYRARSTFTISISFAEFCALVLPFFLHAFAEQTSLLKKVALAAAVVLIGYSMAVLSGSRSGANGLIIGLFCYAGFWTFRRWLLQRHDMIAPAIILAFPAAIAAFIGLTLAWNRLKVMVIGGGQHSYSNQARDVQWAKAWDLAAENPIGYGAARAGDLIDYSSPGGLRTIDSFYINLLVDYGLVGWMAWMAMMVGAIFVGFRLALTTRDKEVLLAAPAAVALTAGLVIKSVLTQPENLPIMFAYIGAIAALAWRVSKAPAAQPAS